MRWRGTFVAAPGEPNRLPRSYHSGVSDDLEAVVVHCARADYEALAVTGFSLGGNVTLKFLGETRAGLAKVRAGAAISVPCDSLFGEPPSGWPGGSARCTCGGFFDQCWTGWT